MSTTKTRGRAAGARIWTAPNGFWAAVYNEKGHILRSEFHIVNHLFELVSDLEDEFGEVPVILDGEPMTDLFRERLADDYYQDADDAEEEF